MSSYESRLKSFETSKYASFKNRESLFAVTGFKFNGIENNDSLTCEFCQKTLEGWEISDIPAKEHYLHSKKCFIFNLKTFSSRKSSFEFYKRDVVNSEQLAKLGYFAYAIKEGHPEVFCYKCGEMCNTLNINYLQKCKEHHTICNKKEDFFFLKLIKGEFNSFFDDYLKYKGSFINNSELYIDLLTGSPFLSVKDVILKNFKAFLFEIKEKMENDELKAVNEIRKEK